VVTGRIKVKVGPVSLTYKGTAKFTERDPDAKVIVLEASGKETRGAGTASATVRATLEPESGGEATKASMHTTMNVTGRPAQFGRGVMVEVGGKLVEQFSQNLRQLMADDAGAGGSNPAATGDEASAGQATAIPETGETGPGSTQPSATIPAAGTATAPAAAAEPTAPAAPAPASDDSINLVKLVGPAILKRAIPVAIAVGGLVVLARLLFRRREKD
jgi:carbon monoxide dehydrogenase subunit G